MLVQLGTDYHCLLQAILLKEALVNKRAKRIGQFFGLLTFIELFNLKIVLSQPITPANDGSGTIVTFPSSNPNHFDISGGTPAGGNLFHSFEQFGLSQSQTANFLSNPSIQNILGRVVGGNASVIDGQIQVTGGNSNLYLLNPAGIIFGSHANLNVPASFTATTANAIGIGDQWFKTLGQNNYATLIGTPHTFAFSTPQVGSIVNSGNLAVPSGQNLTLVGGTFISTGTLSALSGTITIATISGENLVHISQSGSLLSLDLPIETKTTINTDSQPLTPLSLPQLLTGGNVDAVTGVKVNSPEQVVLTSSGIPIENGDVVATHQVTTGRATLFANHNLTLVESQLRTTGELNLVALDTVRVRDSVANPFVAHAQGNINIWGQQGIDIFALNHPQTPFQSGGDIRLVSNGNISGDAHFASGGNFSIRNLAGGSGTFVSDFDPIISSLGDVDFGDYTGVSLKIEALGNITTGNITITESDTMLVGDDPDIPILTSSPALILRAGLSQLENSPNFGQNSYSITNLGSLGDYNSQANSINNPGQVVGESLPVNDSYPHVFLWENGMMKDLGRPNNRPYHYVTSINDSDQLVGTSFAVYRGQPHYIMAFFWENGELTAFDNQYTQAYSINNSGQVAGVFESANNPSGYASLWENGVVINLGTLGGTYSIAHSINNSSQVVGSSSTADGKLVHAFLWQNGVMRDLGTLGGSYSDATSINDLGQVVGNSLTSSGNFYHAFLWQNGIMRDLGTLGGNSSDARSINNSGQVVGLSTKTNGDFPYPLYAFLWQNGQISDLNDLLPPNSGWNTLVSANDINDIGQIVGGGEIGGKFLAFLMTPNKLGSGLHSRGSITVGDISTSGGPVIMSANSDINLRGNISTQGGAISLSPNLHYRSCPSNHPSSLDLLRRTLTPQEVPTVDIPTVEIDTSAIVQGSGLSQHHPFWSIVNTPGVFSFTNVPTHKWYSLPIASGLEYTMTTNSLFTEISSFPQGIDANDRFTVSVDGKVIGEFGANERVVFRNYSQLLGELLVKGRGVPSFTVTGIEPLNDTTISTDFPLQLEFDIPTASFEIGVQNPLLQSVSSDAESTTRNDQQNRE